MSPLQRAKITLSSASTPAHAYGHSRRLKCAAGIYTSPILSIPHLTEMGNVMNTSRGARRELEARVFCSGLRRTTTIWGSGRTDSLGVTCMDIQKNHQGQFKLWVGTSAGIYKEYSVVRCLNEPSCRLDMTTPFAEFSGPVRTLLVITV